MESVTGLRTKEPKLPWHRHVLCRLWLTLGLCLLLVATAAAAQPVTSRTIVVGGDRDYPPYEFIDQNGQPAGYNVDLTRAIAEVMGLQVTFRFGGWADIRAALGRGEVDILQGISHSEDRASILDFSPPHTMVQHAIFARRETPPVSSIAELHGKEVIVFQSGIMHDTLVKQGFGRELVLTDTPAAALRLLASGKHDYAVVAMLPGMYLIRELHLTNLVPVARNVAVQKYGYAVAKGNTELLSRFSEGLAILQQTGQLQAIYDKWLGVQEPARLSWERALRYGAMILVPLLLVLAGTVVWSRTLQRRVTARTAELAHEAAERQRALEELRRHQDKLVQADKMASLGILVSGMAHEINNPNGLILLNLPILKEVYADAADLLEERYRQEGDFLLGGIPYSRMREEVPHLLQEMAEGARRIKRIVEDLKDFARQDAGTLMTPFDLNGVVQAAVRLLENPIRKSTSRLTISYGEQLPQVRGNAQRIEQVVVNLIINACQALTSPEQGILIATRHDAAAGDVILTVQDEGIGISPEHLPHLTDPFFTTKREVGGTGLGLSISAGIIQEHGGNLSFDSPASGGTIVTLTLRAITEDGTP